jgi:hypothetical protein
MPVGDCLQHPPSRAVGLRKSANVTERAIGDDGDTVLFAPRGHRVLIVPASGRAPDRSQRPAPPTWSSSRSSTSGADAPPRILPSARGLEGGDRVLKRMRARQCEKIAIEAALVPSARFSATARGGDQAPCERRCAQYLETRRENPSPPGRSPPRPVPPRLNRSTNTSPRCQICDMCRGRGPGAKRRLLS